MQIEIGCIFAVQSYEMPRLVGPARFRFVKKIGVGPFLARVVRIHVDPDRVDLEFGRRGLRQV
jgi:hypothetical protein